MVEKGIIDKDVIQKNLPRPIGEILLEKGITTASEVESALVEQKHVRDLLETQKKQDSASTIRVKYEKLDTLVNLTGEIVTVQAHLSDFSQSMHNPELISIAEQMERLTAQLREITMSIRMVPIALLFGNFNRLVRDLTATLNKDVDLKVYGGDTELDKNVIESLKEPLLHLIRNALDHGIEFPEERVKKGKKRKGLLELSAGYEGSNISIQIKDDGLGLDKDENLR